MSGEKILQQAEAEKALKGISIPPRPSILNDINTELQRPNPNLAIVAKRIAADVGISGTMLKIVNSPFFGLQNKLSSVSQAVQTLGVKNVKSIVTGLVLRSTLGGGNQAALERFWDGAEKVARISAYVASTLPRAPRDEAYTFGLFRDCAIPILMQRFPSYIDTMQIPTSETCPLTVIEDAHLGTNHAIVGHMVARHWGLPDTITEAVLRHHDITVFSESEPLSPTALNLIAINYLAEHLHEAVLRMRDDPQWRSVGNLVLDHLSMSADELTELKDDIEAAIA